MSNGRALFVVAAILATFGMLVVAGGPALDPGEAPETGLESADDAESSVGEESTNEDSQGDSTDEGDGESADPTRPAVISECAVTPPEDYADPAGNSSDTVGWVEGYWYNEQLDIDPAGGLNETELEILSARTAARVEAIRCLTAEEGVPTVEIQTRDQFQENQSGAFDLSQQQRLADNAELAIRLMSGTETDSTDQREQNRGAAVGGTYNFLTDEVVIVSDDPENLTINEGVLVHEIGHAIQDQHFNLTQYNRSTIDRDKAILGLIEGDVSYLEQQYNEACSSGGWEQECLSYDDSTEDTGGDSAPELANWGLYFQNFQPYNDGPAFIKQIYDSGTGWESVNDAYDEPPTSTLEVVQPDRYPGFERTNVTVPDRSTTNWERYDPSRGPGYEQVGVAGISAMFMAPSIDSEEGSIYTQFDLRAAADLRTLQYFHPEAEGWRGDRLYTYQGTNNDTGAVWTTTWESPERAEPFVESYEELIGIRGGEAVGENTYEFDSDSGYEMALTIRTNGSRVTVVTAPTVDQLDAVHAPASEQSAS